MQVIDNFLSTKDWQRIEKTMITGGLLPWCYNNMKVSGDDSINNYQFTHEFFNFHSINGPCQRSESSHLEILKPLVDKLNMVALHRIKGNLEPLKAERHYSNWHTDINPPTKNMTTAIYYVNTNDGYTEFENGRKVKCFKNRFVSFPSNLKHRGVSQTDNKVKCIINLNYFGYINENLS